MYFHCFLITTACDSLFLSLVITCVIQVDDINNMGAIDDQVENNMPDVTNKVS